MSVPGSLSAAQASLREWDVLVIGAGVGGSIAARELAQMNCRVLLIDKKNFPRRKVCGACLNASGLQLLARIGLSGLVPGLGGLPVRRLTLNCGGRRVDLPLLEGRSVSREKLDLALVEASMESGVEFLPETCGTIDPGVHADGWRTVTLAQHESVTQVKARVVIVASGLGAQGLPSTDEWSTWAAPAARVGAGCVLEMSESGYLPETIWMAVGRRGYVGLVRLEDHRLNVAAAFDRPFLAEFKSPGAAAGFILTEAGLNCPSQLSSAEWHGTVTLSRRITPVAHQRVFLIGDAASYIEPFTGEGMAWAMESALRVAPWARRAVGGWSQDVEQGWIREYRCQIQKQQRTCRVVSHLLHNSSLQAISIMILQAWPGLAKLVMRR